MFTVLGGGCIEAPETAQWPGHTRQDLSVTNVIDAQNEPDLEADRVVSDMAPVAADAFATDGGLELDSRLSPLGSVDL